MLATLFTRQLLFDGVVTGMVYGLVAMGIVLVYRSTRVINFAVANLGFIGAGIFALLVAQYGVPFWIAAVVGLVLGFAYGAVIELIVIRRLFTAPRVIVLVATIGIAQLVARHPGVAPRDRRPRRPVPRAHRCRPGDRGHPDHGAVSSPSSSWSRSSPSAWVGSSTAQPSARRSRPRPTTPTSPASPASARRRCRPWCGPSPVAWRRCRCRCWPAPPARPRTWTTSGPARLTRALAAAVIAGMASFPRAFLAGIAIGIIQALDQLQLPRPARAHGLPRVPGRGGRGVLAEPAGGGARPRPSRSRPRPHRSPNGSGQIWWLRQIDRIALCRCWSRAPSSCRWSSPRRPGTCCTPRSSASPSAPCRSRFSPGGRASCPSVRWPSPASARCSPPRSRGASTSTSGGARPGSSTRGSRPLRFGPSLVFSALITAGIAALIGVGALRVRGLYLAVVTFAFGLAAQQYIYQRPILQRRLHRLGSAAAHRHLRHRHDLTAVHLLRDPRRPGRGHHPRVAPAARPASAGGRSPSVTTRTPRPRTRCRTPGRSSGPSRWPGAWPRSAALLARRQPAGGTERPVLHGHRLAHAGGDRGHRRPGVGGRARSWGRCGSSGCPRSSPTTTSSRCSPRASVCSSCSSTSRAGLIQIGYAARAAIVRWHGGTARPAAAEGPARRPGPSSGGTRAAARGCSRPPGQRDRRPVRGHPSPSTTSRSRWTTARSSV